jgi:hypothetical protein
MQRATRNHKKRLSRLHLQLKQILRSINRSCHVIARKSRVQIVLPQPPVAPAQLDRLIKRAEGLRPLAHAHVDAAEISPRLKTLLGARDNMSELR